MLAFFFSKLKQTTDFMTKKSDPQKPRASLFSNYSYYRREVWRENLRLVAGEFTNDYWSLFNLLERSLRLEKRLR